MILLGAEKISPRTDPLSVLGGLMKKDERKRFSEKGHGAHTVGSSDSRNETDADVVYQATEEGVPHNSLWMQSSSQSQENDIMNQGVLDDSFVSQGDKKIDAERGSKKRQRQGDCGDEDGKDAGGVIPRRETQEATYALTEHQAKDEEETKRTKKEFIAKIHKILEDAELENNKHIISWGPDGKSFKVHNPGAFVKEIMPRYSAATKFRSFEKMLNLYDFKKIKGGLMEGGYEHPLFRKDDRELCKKIKIRPRPRQRTASSGGSGGSSVSDYRPSRDREPKRRKASEGGLEEDSRLSSIQDISMGYFQQMATGHQFDRDETQQGYQNIRNSLQTSTSAIPSFLDAISGNRSISIMGNASSSMDQHTLRYDPTIIGSIGTLNRNPPFTAAASLAAFGSFFQVPIIPTDIGGRTMPSFSGGLENTVAVVPRPPEERILPPSVFDRIYNPNQVVGSSNLLFFDPTRASPSQHHFSEESKQNEDSKSENIFQEPLCDDLEPTHLPPPA